MVAAEVIFDPSHDPAQKSSTPHTLDNGPMDQKGYFFVFFHSSSAEQGLEYGQETVKGGS